jgi:hypothetical protein
VGQPAPELIQAGEPGALCAKWSGLQTTLRQVPTGGAPPAPAPAAHGSGPSTGALWPRSMEEDSWPWATRGRAPALT